MIRGGARGLGVKTFGGMAGMLVLALAGTAVLWLGGIVPTLKEKHSVKEDMTELRLALEEAMALKPIYEEASRTLESLRDPLRNTRLVRPVELSGLEGEEDLLRAQLGEAGATLRQFSVQLGERKGGEQRAQVDLRIRFRPERLNGMLSVLEEWPAWRRMHHFTMEAREAGNWQMNCSLEVGIR